MARMGTISGSTAERGTPFAGAAAECSLLDPRVLPFAAYMTFIAVAALLAWMGEEAVLTASWERPLELWLYPVKTAVVLGLLLWFWPRYVELKDGLFIKWTHLAEGLLIGVLVYLAWVRMDWSWATQGTLTGYDPSSAGSWAPVLIAVRLFGAAVVVPIMEELFWRSFLIRYVDAPQYRTVRVGMFSIKACLVTVVLFGLEHQLWLAGMMAGAAYSLVLYRTKRLWPCILAHGTTNLILGFHVLLTGEWKWW